jgi:hypothetical protein
MRLCFTVATVLYTLRENRTPHLRKLSTFLLKNCTICSAFVEVQKQGGFDAALPVLYSLLPWLLIKCMHAAAQVLAASYQGRATQPGVASLYRAD